MTADTTAPADESPPAPSRRQARLKRKQRDIAYASQRQLIWWRFRRSPLAMAGLVMTALLYAIAIFGPFLAPSSPDQINAKPAYAPPQQLHLFDDGRFDPWVPGYTSTVDEETLERKYVPDENAKIKVGFFVQGAEYKLIGLIPGDRHFIGPKDPTQQMFLLGTDGSGRDFWSRLLHGAQISMSIGLVGITVSLIIGVLVGGISGYFSGTVDLALQRLIEFIGVLPTIPLWLGLAAALPAQWPPAAVYFGITLILALVGWMGLSRVVRGRFLTIRDEDFVISARLDGCNQLQVILRHMLPALTSHIVASLTLAVPAMILGRPRSPFWGSGSARRR